MSIFQPEYWLNILLFWCLIFLRFRLVLRLVDVYYSIKTKTRIILCSVYMYCMYEHIKKISRQHSNIGQGSNTQIQGKGAILTYRAREQHSNIGQGSNTQIQDKEVTLKYRSRKQHSNIGQGSNTQKQGKKATLECMYRASEQHSNIGARKQHSNIGQ